MAEMAKNNETKSKLRHIITTIRKWRKGKSFYISLPHRTGKSSKATTPPFYREIREESKEATATSSYGHTYYHIKEGVISWRNQKKRIVVKRNATRKWKIIESVKYLRPTSKLASIKMTIHISRRNVFSRREKLTWNNREERKSTHEIGNRYFSKISMAKIISSENRRKTESYAYIGTENNHRNRYLNQAIIENISINENRHHIITTIKPTIGRRRAALEKSAPWLPHLLMKIEVSMKISHPHVISHHIIIIRRKAPKIIEK